MIQPIPPITNEEITGQFVVHLIGADAGMILEIDAHHGGHTAAFLKFFPRAQIHAVMCADFQNHSGICSNQMNDKLTGDFFVGDRRDELTHCR